MKNKINIPVIKTTEFDTYKEQLNDNLFKQIDYSLWDIIEIEGLNEEFNNMGEFMEDWYFLPLNISEEDSKGLMELDENIVEKFNRFDIWLKEKYENKYIDLIDYNKGEINIITCMINSK